MTIKNILISQQPPKAASQYSSLTEKYGVKFVFTPFFRIKRKIFFGDGTPASILEQIGSKHKGEKFLIAMSDSANNDISAIFSENGFDFDSAVFVKSVSQDLKSLDMHSFDMIVLYNPADVKSLYENFPDFTQDGIRFVSYGKSVIKAMNDAGLQIEISAPTAEAPSVAKAIEIYLEQGK